MRAAIRVGARVPSRPPSPNVWLEALCLSDAQVALPTPHLVSASVLWPHFIPRRIFCVFAARQCCPVDHAHVGCISAWSWSLSCQEPALDVILDSKAPRHSQNTTCVSKTVRIRHWLQNFQYFPPATACPEPSVLKVPHVSW